MAKISAECVVECVTAMHLSSYVPGLGEHRGGLFLCGPPGALKTTFLDYLESYENVLPMSDINNKTLMSLKSELQMNTIKTIVFPEYSKVYERDPRTALNVEGSIKALAEEGFRGASFEASGSGLGRFTSRACIIGAMTPEFRDLNWERWGKSGFTRRFLWALIRLDDPEILMDAVSNWEKKDIASGYSLFHLPTSWIIPQLSKSERVSIRPLVRYQPKPNNFAYELLCKMTEVLVWQYKKKKIKKDPLKTVREFSECLGKNGAEVIL